MGRYGHSCGDDWPLAKSNFGRKSVAEAFLNDHAEGWRKWFAWLCPWDDSRIQTQRVVWLKISGVPVHCWDQNIFEVIASRFGRVLIPNECSKEVVDLSHRRVCILAMHDRMFNDCHEVVWKKTSFTIRVQEDGDWAPPCVTKESSDSESEEDDCLDRNSLDIMDDCEDGCMDNNSQEKNMKDDQIDDGFSCDRRNINSPATVVVDSAEEERRRGSVHMEDFEEAVPDVQHDDSISKVEGNDVVGHAMGDDTCNNSDGQEVGSSEDRSLGSKDRSRSAATCSGSISLSSCDCEVENTVELGEDLGFRIKDAKASLRAAIECEGDFQCAQ
ncbi:hypothetical protein L1887_11319 [Cichorium endivia]|nr:hypothetical protein L1887_11319 [Cichorium endivia]